MEEIKHYDRAEPEKEVSRDGKILQGNTKD